MRCRATSILRAALALASVAGGIAGCAVAHIDHPVVERINGNRIEDHIEFWHTLAKTPVACNDDAFHGLLLDLDGRDSSADYADRVAALQARQLLPAGFNRPGNEAISRGTLAVILVRALHIKGGVIMRLTGVTPRYAVRELRYTGLFPPSSENQGFSGLEYLNVIARFEEIRSGANDDVPASIMPG